MDAILPPGFYDRPTVEVARDLIGARLVHKEGRRRIAGIIVETEAYCGEEDLGCHAKAGRTPRTQVLYGPPGHAYVYLNYGMHWLFNVVTRPVDQPEAVLIRAIIPTESLAVVAQRRGRQPRKVWTDGPGKLTQALGITGAYNTLDITVKNAPVFIEQGLKIPDQFVTTTPRIGFNTVPEPWKSMEWRYLATLPDGYIKN
jgi:DNA-3-methyladenine glycosylase